jgi:hypothetical protein
MLVAIPRIEGSAVAGISDDCAHNEPGTGQDQPVFACLPDTCGVGPSCPFC